MPSGATSFLVKPPRWQSSSGHRFRGSAAKKFPDSVGYEFDLFCERKVTGVEKVKLGTRNVLQKGLRSSDGEERIVFPPNDEHLRLLGAEVLMPFAIEGDVCSVVMEEVELDGIIPGAVEEMLIERIGIWADTAGIVRAVRVLETGGIGGEKTADWLFGVWIAIGPEGLQGFECGADPFDISVAILNDDGIDGFRVTRGDAEAYGSPVILNEDAELVDAEGVEE